MMTGFIGGMIGVAGGLIGTYFSIKNTNGPRERAFMIRAALVGWAGISLFLALLFILPGALRWIWVPYFILLFVGIRYTNKRQMAIRRAESEASETTASRLGKM